MLRGHIAGFYRSAGREAPVAEDMDGLVLMAMQDWRRIPDADLAEVCGKARELAAERQGNYPATTAEVRRAWSWVSEVHHRQAHQREERARQAMIASGRILPEPTLTEMSEAGRQAALAEFRKAAGLA